jgi:hypothetical protein
MYITLSARDKVTFKPASTHARFERHAAPLVLCQVLHHATFAALYLSIESSHVGGLE